MSLVFYPLTLSLTGVLSLSNFPGNTASNSLTGVLSLSSGLSLPFWFLSSPMLFKLIFKSSGLRLHLASVVGLNTNDLRGSLRGDFSSVSLNVAFIGVDDDIGSGFEAGRKC